jgi:hypothetical protein
MFTVNLSVPPDVELRSLALYDPADRTSRPTTELAHQFRALTMGDGCACPPTVRKKLLSRQPVPGRRAPSQCAWWACTTAWPLPRAMSQRFTGHAAAPAMISATVNAA